MPTFVCGFICSDFYCADFLLCRCFVCGFCLDFYCADFLLCGCFVCGFQCGVFGVFLAKETTGRTIKILPKILSKIPEHLQVSPHLDSKNPGGTPGCPCIARLPPCSSFKAEKDHAPEKGEIWEVQRILQVTTLVHRHLSEARCLSWLACSTIAEPAKKSSPQLGRSEEGKAFCSSVP